jgi:23S rRNA (adenine2503-C2)-methyltransferase
MELICMSECLTPATSRAGLLGVDPETLRAWCERVGEPGYRAKQVLEWVYERRVNRFDDMSNVPKRLRGALDATYRLFQGDIIAEQRATDGTRKLLLEWAAGGRTECVLIPDERRQTACISTQVGCPVGCVFCASGIGGLERNLAAAEIVEQALRLATLAAPERLSNIVFMGLGEPLANYSETLTAVRVINAEWGLNIGARKITISTVGLPSQMRRLADEQLQVTLALSLHAPTDELRRELIPWARSISIDELVDASRYYFEQTGREVTLEYVLLGGVNDGPSHARALARVADQMRCNVNLIRYNPVDGLPYRRPTSEAAAAFQSVLRDAGVNVHVRKSRGLDIDAACGQLRRRLVNIEQGDPCGTA